MLEQKVYVLEALRYGNKKWKQILGTWENLDQAIEDAKAYNDRRGGKYPAVAVHEVNLNKADFGPRYIIFFADRDFNVDPQSNYYLSYKKDFAAYRLHDLQDEFSDPVFGDHVLLKFCKDNIDNPDVIIFAYWLSNRAFSYYSLIDHLLIKKDPSKCQKQIDFFRKYYPSFDSLYEAALNAIGQNSSPEG